MDSVFAREQFDAVITSQALVGTVPILEKGAILLSDTGQWEQLLEEGGSALDTLGLAPEARFLTSGSTGVPKTVVRAPLPTEIAALRNKRFVESWGIEPGMRTAITGPVYHQAPLYHAMGAIQAAECIVILDSFDAQSVLSAISEYNLTHLHLVPSMMMKIAALSDEELAGHDCSSLRFVLHGAAHCPTDVKLRLIEHWGPIFREYYATSEFGMVTQIDAPEWLERPSSVGRTFDGVEIEIRDLASGEPIPVGQVGRIFVRSDDMPDFSYADGAGDLRTYHRGEFITVNDVGFLDAEGYLHLTGRSDDIAVISGINFSAEATRQALLRNAAVENAVVSVVSDTAKGDRFVAAVKLRDGVDAVSEMEILAQLKPHLPRLAVPRSLQIVDELPAFDTGKIVRRYLKDFTAQRAPGGATEQAGPSRLAIKPRLPDGVRVVHFPITESTNKDALAGAETSNDRLCLYYADQQTAGQGRQGRTWVSPVGNLYWTMLVDCSEDPAHSLGLVFVTALAVRYTVEALAPADARVQTKWPNDTLIDGRKVSGVKIDSALSNGLKRAVGIGINVETFPAYGMIYPATSLRAEGSAASRDDVLTLLTANFVAVLEFWRREGFQALKANYLAGAYRFKQSIPVRQDDRSIISGVYEDASEAGIVLRLQSGELVTFATGDIISPPIQT